MTSPFSPPLSSFSLFPSFFSPSINAHRVGVEKEESVVVRRRVLSFSLSPLSQFFFSSFSPFLYPILTRDQKESEICRRREEPEGAPSFFFFFFPFFFPFSSLPSLFPPRGTSRR